MRSKLCLHVSKTLVELIYVLEQPRRVGFPETGVGILIAKNVQLLLVLGVYSFSFGVPVVWIGVLTFSLRVIDIHQEQAMGVAVVAVCMSSVAAFVIARITDKMYGHLRVTIIGLLLASAACFLWFVLISTGVIEPSLVQVYISVAGGVSFEYASVPLLVELAVELGYPISESVTGAALTFLFNVVALVFLGLFQIPSDYMWVSYVLLACVSLTIIPLMFVKETHKRSEADRKEISHNAGSASSPPA
ncbi:solute carrier family 49 member 4 homolog [Penaeus chinensis]|uniref:solute carrier family 49 member 4 homolog n=1 Tax=Penaeus chinensis TaxID=139456 RepID=UPI001FB5B661|nr:solute carrier family 49 member 4 homolog [Penaeus chinensis]